MEDKISFVLFKEEYIFGKEIVNDSINNEDDIIGFWLRD